jgi:GcrA cell cycle regulator
MSRHEPASLKKPDVLWTAEEDALLEKAWGAGESARDIAARLGRSRNSVIGRVNRKGLTAKLRGAAYVPPPRLKRVRVTQVLWKFEKVAPPVKIAKPENSGQFRPTVVAMNFKTPAPVLPPKSKDWVEPLMINIMDLRHKFHCSYPVDGEDQTMYCGHRTSGHSYCPYHRSVMYDPPTVKTRKRYA